MDIELLKTVSGLGVGALFGIIVYMMSLREHRDARTQLQGLVEQVLAQNKEALDAYQNHLKADLGTREDNTRALTRLATIIERLEGKL